MEDAQRGTDPVLITDAARSYEEELAVRKRRYKIMMGMRIPLMLAAAAFYHRHHSSGGAASTASATARTRAARPATRARTGSGSGR